MSYCREEGKDRIVFMTREDYEKPSKALVTTKSDDDDDEEPGLILKDGTINWNCPCLGGMASGPCGIPFREAFSCFHYSNAEPKGSDCFEPFKQMQDCMGEYPELYPKDDDSSKDPLANAPDKPDEKVLSETNSSESATETDTSAAEVKPSEAAPAENSTEETTAKTTEENTEKATEETTAKTTEETTEKSTEETTEKITEENTAEATS